MKPLIHFIFFLLITCASAAQPVYWQQDLQYDISVTLNDKNNTLDGFLKLNYQNNSPDTLWYIWFHLWPNAFKSDRTAFSDQLLENGRTDFYFSDDDKRGYINRLDFRINQQAVKTEDHPEWMDAVKLLLPDPLLPGASVQITTPFHVKLPYNFSRGGYHNKTYQITQWYPKPAVYDRKGWHIMPYLDQGEFFSEFGDYEVKITVPTEYIVAATGELQNPEEITALEEKSRAHQSTPAAGTPAVKSKSPQKKNTGVSSKTAPKKTENPNESYLSETAFKTLIFRQKKVHDFAWFADKKFQVHRDTLQLSSGRTIGLQVFHQQHTTHRWANSIGYLKNAIRYHSEWIGEYPWNIATVVEGKQGFSGGMEYPTITILHKAESETAIEDLIFHEVGHNWFYGILASNERDHPWMDEGMNTYYDKRYSRLKSEQTLPDKQSFKALESKLESAVVATVIANHTDQPISTASTQLTAVNYGVITYLKAGEWMRMLEKELGTPLFDSAMRAYYRRWQFKHPYPEDFRHVMEAVSGRDLESLFSLLHNTGPLNPPPSKTFKVAPFLRINDKRDHHYLFISPAAGFNLYDGFMAGALFHNYTLPLSPFGFAVAPLYGFKSKSLAGIAHLNYTWFPNNTFREIELSATLAKFTKDAFTDEAGTKLKPGFFKLAPGLRFEFKNQHPRSTKLNFAEIKHFFIRDEELQFSRDTVANINIASKKAVNRNITRARVVLSDQRVLYPYRLDVQMDLSKDFGRLGVTGNYFFNFRKKGGVDVRLFAGKFIYFGEKTNSLRFATDRYHLNMTAPNGYEDYTYSNYFLGRNEFEGFFSQQIMNRDGNFKVRTDKLSSKVGKTDNWLVAGNVTLDVPDKLNILHVLPVKIPLKLFADFGTYAEVWDKDSEDPRLLFDAGVQVSLFRSAINIYVPLVYSKVYRDYFKSVPGNKFFQRISFSINIPEFTPRKWINDLLK